MTLGLLMSPGEGRPHSIPSYPCCHPAVGKEGGQGRQAAMWIYKAIYGSSSTSSNKAFQVRIRAGRGFTQRSTNCSLEEGFPAMLPLRVFVGVPMN